MIKAATMPARTLLYGLLAAFALAGVAGTGTARAAEPWWHIASGWTPSLVQSGSARDEVQEIKVQATRGRITVIEPVSLEEYEHGEGPPKYALFNYDATSAEVQVALETVYGAGNVEVQGGPGDASGTSPYVVTFTGARADQLVPLMLTKRYNLGGLEGEANTSQAIEGRPDGTMDVEVANLGDTDVTGEATPVTIADTLPEGLTAKSVEAFAGSSKRGSPYNRGRVDCSIESERSVGCTFNGTLPPYEAIELRIGTLVEHAPSGAGKIIVSGGNAARAEAAGPTLNMGGTPAYGVERYEMKAEDEGGRDDQQAGWHPFQLTTLVRMNSASNVELPPGMAKSLAFRLPPGLIGDPSAVPQCTEVQFNFGEDGDNECPDDTAVGVAEVHFYNDVMGDQHMVVPLFNLTPFAGEPARFGFEGEGITVYVDTSVRTGSDYGVTVSVRNITQVATMLSSRITFWGVPGAAQHDDARGWSCVGDGARRFASFVPPCEPLGRESPPPLLTMPTACGGPLASPLLADSWEEQGVFREAALDTPMPALDGCNRERFEPTITTAPDYEEASRPSGLSIDVHVPQQLQTDAEATAESEVREIKVELPKGITLNPGGADGLQACSESEVGYHGKEEGGNEVAFEFFSPIVPEPFCPKAAKIGTAIIHTPLLPNPLEGAIYIADPALNGEVGQNPYKSLIAMYLVAEDPVSGVLVKLPMEVTLNKETGQITTVVQNPQLPFEDAELHFFGGSRAPLTTPGLCGSYTTVAYFSPWSEPSRQVISSSTFNITSGPNRSPCPSNPKPFAPEFNAGMVNNQAGGYSELRTTMGHPDVDQALGALEMTLPPGVMGSLSDVKLCGEPQAAEGTCGPESLIGHTTVTAGLGSEPAVVARPGNVYITGPFNGHGACTVGEAGCAPFGLSIANPAETGPFDLEKGTKCDCIVIRARVEVDPHTAQLKIRSAPLPTMLKGVPLDLQHVSVQIDRPDFTFNPTSCDPMKIEGVMSGAEGASVPVSEPFQAANCAALPFAPELTVITKAHHSRNGGAYLGVKVASGAEQANIRSVHVELPKALPSRLNTLNHACLDSVFNRDPAGCPSQSRVGFAKAVTPVLPVPLEGPAYFVSHGGQRFPELIVVLQGYGVTVYLDGETAIKSRITSSTFKTVPDVPVGSFELTLPEGEYSALAANTNLCAANLVMPNTFDAQNGAVLHQNTPIEVQGCPYALRIVRRRVKKRTLMLKVSVPAAGRLAASGKGVSKAAKTAKGRSTFILTLKEDHAGKLRTKVLLRFTPAKGKQRKVLRKSITVAFR